MFRILFATSFIALLACGSGESNQGNAINPGDTPPVSAAGTATDDIEIERIEVEAIEADPVAAEVTSCLDLVRTGAFEAALPMCLQAASIDPENAEVQAALAKSQAKVAMEDAPRRPRRRRRPRSTVRPLKRRSGRAMPRMPRAVRRPTLWAERKTESIASQGPANSASSRAHGTSR